MKRISYYLILIVIVSLGLISFWTYQKYLKKEARGLLLFKVERGAIEEIVKARGEVAPQKEFGLEFPFSGVVENIFVEEGQKVQKGAALVKLEITDFEIEIQRLNAVLDQRKANLNKLVAGATPEDINISETKVANAKIALEDTKQNLVDKIQDGYTKADDAVRNKTDQLFNNPRSPDPKINFLMSDAQLKSDLEMARLSSESLLVSWATSLNSLTVDSDLNIYAVSASKNLDQVKLFLDNMALAVNSLTPNANLTQTKIDTWRIDVFTARTNINIVINNLSLAQEKLRSAESTLSLAKNELIFKKASPRSEDIETAKAQIKEIESQIAAANEKIQKAVLSAPVVAEITKIWLEEKELFKTGQPVISLSTSLHKIQADVSELDIGKIYALDGNEVLIQFDAFPKQEFKGKVVSIEPKEIIKEGDKYYRINVYMEKHEESLRNGMSADLKIAISSKEDVLKIPALTIYEKDSRKFVKVLDVGKQKEVEIETGISDGEFIETVKGLVEGQTIVVSAD